MTQTVYIIDDDHAMRDALQQLLKTAGFQVQTYARGAEFLAACSRECQGCIVLDVAMPGLSGQQVQQTLSERGIHLPIIFLTGHGDVRMAVDAIQAGAINFLEKPLRGGELITQVRKALELDRERGKSAYYAELIRQNYARLTPRELEVMWLVVAGQSNKSIAKQLQLSKRTIEAHRLHMMQKMGAENLAELVAMVNRGSLDPDQNTP